MKVFKKITDIQAHLQKQKNLGSTIGFVPTMGALHEGHLSLMAACKKACNIAVASIFVNPTQFNDKSDLEKYPRTIGPDLEALAMAGCDVLFYPDVAEIYPSGEITRNYDLQHLETVFEGSFRSGHFQGVCRVLDKLFTIVNPDKVFFGQKDYQQCMVIKRLMNIVPEFHSIEMTIVPTMREPSGLAMSSRNTRLSSTEKQTAATIYKTLLYIQENIRSGNLGQLQQNAITQLQQNGFVVDYVGIADAATLEPVTEWDGQKQLVALIAAFLGNVRLIDNLLLS